MKKIILSALVLTFLASCASNGNQQNNQEQQSDSLSTKEDSSKVEETKQVVEDIVDETTILDIYNLIPDKKEGFKKFEKRHEYCFYQQKLLRENEGDGDYLTETLNFYKYKDGGYLLIFAHNGDENPYTKLYDYKEGKLTSSSIKLPKKNTKDLIEDYLFFLGAEDRVVSENVTAIPYKQDTLSCYYDPNDGYEFDFDYAYGSIEFAWDGQKFVELPLNPSKSDYVNEFGLCSYWTVDTVKLMGTHPKKIKGYTIKEENGLFVYYLNNQKRFSIAEDESGIQRINVFTSTLDFNIGYDREHFEEFHSNAIKQECDGLPAYIEQFENHTTKIYYFDKKGKKLESVSVIAGE